MLGHATLSVVAAMAFAGKASEKTREATARTGNGRIGFPWRMKIMEKIILDGGARANRMRTNATSHVSN